MSACNRVIARAKALALQLSVIALVATLHAQVPAGGGVIIGRVVDVDSGEPIPGARVAVVDAAGGRTMTGGSNSNQVIADSQGRFSFSGLRPGSLSLSTLTTEANVANRASVPTLVELAANEVVRDVVVRSVQSAWISGRVTDESGQPMVGSSVVAFVRSGPSFGAVRSALTDDRGDYTIDPLMPGEYIVCACGWRAPLLDVGMAAVISPFLQPPTRSRAPTYVEVRVDEAWRPPARAFHPTATQPSGATVLSLRSNEERTNIDIGVTTRGLATVSGRIAGLPGAMTSSVIQLQSAGEPGQPVLPPLEAHTITPDGVFRFVDVSPGRYMVTVRYRGPDPPGRPLQGVAQLLGVEPSHPGAPPPPTRGEITHWAAVPITLDGRDLRDLVVPVVPALELSGRVLFSENGAVEPLRANGGRLVRLDEAIGDLGVSASVRADDDGRFTLTGLVPGRYHFQWTILPPGLTLQSITFGGRDVTDTPLTVDETIAQTFVVTLVTNDAGTVTGQLIVQPPDAGPYAIVAFPADRRLWTEPAVSARRFFRTSTDQTGRFRLEDVPPGDYIIASLPLQGRSWQILDSLDALSATGRQVRVVRGDNPGVEIRR